jgi:hypothetical protein
MVVGSMVVGIVVDFKVNVVVGGSLLVVVGDGVVVVGELVVVGGCAVDVVDNDLDVVPSLAVMTNISTDGAGIVKPVMFAEICALCKSCLK